jgi:hypothetical protein
MRQDHAACARELPGDDRVRHDRLQVDERGRPSESAYRTLRPRVSVLTATVSELAAITGLTLKNTSRVVKELRKRGGSSCRGTLQMSA